MDCNPGASEVSIVDDRGTTNVAATNGALSVVVARQRGPCRGAPPSKREQRREGLSCSSHFLISMVSDICQGSSFYGASTRGRVTMAI